MCQYLLEDCQEDSWFQMAVTVGIMMMMLLGGTRAFNSGQRYSRPCAVNVYACNFCYSCALIVLGSVLGQHVTSATTSTGCSSSFLQFQLQPADQKVMEGEDALFRCTYTGTTSAPLVAIAGELFSLSNLPRKYSFSGLGIKVTNVDLSMNGTAIACGFEYYDVNSGTLEQCYSSTGVLYVKEKSISPEDYDPTSDVAKMVTSNSFNVWIALLLTVTITTHSVCE